MQSLTPVCMAMIAATVPQAEIDDELARREFGDFCRVAIPGYIDGAHVAQLRAVLEAVERGEIPRLMVFMPPRYSKSFHVSQAFPCWCLGRRPEWNVALTSYAQSLALEQSRRARDLFARPIIHRIFPRVYHVPGREGQEPIPIERQAAQEWGTSRGGRYYAVGIGGGLTGRGFDLGIIDDPVKDREAADSPTIREKTWSWYQSTFYTRRMPGAAIILCQTRWHPDDLAGRLLEESKRGRGEEWHVLSMPVLDSEGRPLWPEFWSLEEVEKTRQAMDVREWAALYMQAPTVAGGSIFKRDWWADGARYDAEDRALVNSCVARVHSWDTAEKTEEGNAYSARVVGELTPDYQMVTREVWRARLEFPALCEEIERAAKRDNADGKLRAVIIEDKSSGTSAIQMLMTQGPGWLREIIHPVTPKGDKIQRCYQASVWCNSGVVWLPRPSAAVPWLHDFEEELFSAPASKYMDQVDAFTQLVWYWTHLLASGIGMEGYA